ncbi:MAG: CHAD domain-containing protein [Terriglobales bacterium]
MPIDQQRSRTLFLKLNRLLSRVPAHPTPEAVHQLRTTTRRVEAMLETLSPDGDRNQRRLARSLRRVRRRAGRIRDLDVHQAALRSLKIGRDSTRKQQLVNELAERRSRQERKLLNRLDRESVADLRKSLRRAAEPILKPANGRRRSRSSATSNPGPRPKPVEEPLAIALRMFARLARETGPLTDANLHQFRTRCKRVRYVAEMGGDTREIQAVVKEFKRLQDAVGIWHDWLTLTQTADKLFAGANDSALLNALQNISRAKFVEALRTASEVKRNLLAVRVPAPRPARPLPKPRAAARPAAPQSARPAKRKVARKARAVPEEGHAEPQPEPEHPEAPPAKPSQPETVPEPETSEASA